MTGAHDRSALIPGFVESDVVAGEDLSVIAVNEDSLLPGKYIGDRKDQLAGGPTAILKYKFITPALDGFPACRSTAVSNPCANPQEVDWRGCGGCTHGADAAVGSVPARVSNGGKLLTRRSYAGLIRPASRIP